MSWQSKGIGADARNSNNQYTQQQQTGYPLVDIGYGQQQQQLQPQYTSYNVGLVPMHQLMIAIPRSNDGATTTATTARGVHATDADAGATAPTRGMDATAAVHATATTAAAATTIPLRSAYGLWLQQPLRHADSAAATTSTAFLHPTTIVILPPRPDGHSSNSSTPANPTATDGHTVPSAEKGRRAALSAGRSPRSRTRRRPGYFRKQR